MILTTYSERYVPRNGSTSLHWHHPHLSSIFHILLLAPIYLPNANKKDRSSGLAKGNSFLFLDLSISLCLELQLVTSSPHALIQPNHSSPK